MTTHSHLLKERNGELIMAVRKEGQEVSFGYLTNTGWRSIIAIVESMMKQREESRPTRAASAKKKMTNLLFRSGGKYVRRMVAQIVRVHTH